MSYTKVFLPFSDTNDEEFMQTTIGNLSQSRKISFKKLVQKLTEVNVLICLTYSL